VAFKDNLRRLRTASVLSQSDLADKSGVSKLTITRAEAGKVMPHPRTIRKLAAALGVEPAALVKDQ
jgi:transcriptional regulator with XRE-family HTH domain